MTRRFLFTLAVMSATAGLVRPQTTKPASGEAELQKAIVVEESERNLKEAERLYRAIAEAPGNTGTVRSEAWLRLGRLLSRLGRKEEAASVLRNAAAGEGDAAKRAQAEITGTAEPKSELFARVSHLMAVLRDAQDDQVGRAIADLQWVGEPAVPHITTIVREHKTNLEFVARAVRALKLIGGATANAFVKEAAATDDTLFKRAIIRGFHQSQQVTGPLDDGLRSFLKDPDPQIRREAVDALNTRLREEEIVTLASDASPRVRQAAIRFLLSKIGQVAPVHADGKGKEPTDESIKTAITVLSNAFDDPDGGVRQAAADLTLGGISRTLARSPIARDFFLRFLQRTELEPSRGYHAQLVPSEPSGRVPEVTLEPAISSEALVAVARKLGPVPEPENRQGVGWRHVWVLELVRASLPGWKTDAMERVLELVALRYDRAPARPNALSGWVLEHAGPEHASSIAKVLESFFNPGTVAKWLAKHKNRPEVLTPLRDYIEERIKTRDWGQGVANSLDAICALGTDEADQYLLDLVGRHTAQGYSHVSLGLMKRAEPLATRALLDLLVLEVKDPKVSEQVAPDRNKVFFWLVRRGSKEALEKYPVAYDRGLHHSTAHFGIPWDHVALRNDSGRGIQWLAKLENRPELTFAHRYDAATAARILEECLVRSPRDAWHDLRGLLEQMRSENMNSWGGKTVWLADELLAVASRKALDCPETGLRPTIVAQLLMGFGKPVPGAHELAAKTLSHEDRDLKIAALGKR